MYGGERRHSDEDRLSHIVSDKHDQRFHKAWNVLRDEYEKQEGVFLGCVASCSRACDVRGQRTPKEGTNHDECVGEPTKGLALAEAEEALRVVLEEEEEELEEDNEEMEEATANDDAIAMAMSMEDGW